MKLTDLVRERRSDILRVAQQHGASNVRLFGSVARGEADESSDIDLLVDLEPGRSLLDHAALVLELEQLLGWKVDVATERGLRSVLRERVLQDATPL
jgi:predicted nucleotidyltransferase